MKQVKSICRGIAKVIWFILRKVILMTARFTWFIYKVFLAKILNPFFKMLFVKVMEIYLRKKTFRKL